MGEVSMQLLYLTVLLICGCCVCYREWSTRRTWRCSGTLPLLSRCVCVWGGGLVGEWVSVVSWLLIKQIALECRVSQACKFPLDRVASGASLIILPFLIKPAQLLGPELLRYLKVCLPTPSGMWAATVWRAVRV